MIHPHAQLKFVNGTIGLGVYASAPIPKGTIVYAADPFEIEITPRQFEVLSDFFKEIAEKYSYIDSRGVRIMSWDLAKYVNHSCDPNTMSTGYGFEIAIKDIAKGEQITDEYGLLNIENEIPLACRCQNCRKVLRPTDIDTYYPIWDTIIKDALDNIRKVPQPLWSLIGKQTKSDLIYYLRTKKRYKSVYTLKYVKTEKQRTARMLSEAATVPI
jgi:hypothetical protein